jgi:hypothetical protein
MNEIPEDIMMAASKVADEIGGYSRDPLGDEIKIARAILAERERCASLAERIPIAELQATSATADHIELTWRTAALVQRSTIAAAIRKGQAKEGEGA